MCIISYKVNCISNLFFVAIKSKPVILVVMKVREIKIRKKVLFTKSRPHADKSKYNRKPKHKKNYEY